MTDEEKVKVTRLLDAGYSVNAVKRELGHSWDTIRKINDGRLGRTTASSIAEGKDTWSDDIAEYKKLLEEDKLGALDKLIELIDQRIHEKLIKNDGFTLHEAVVGYKNLVDVRQSYGQALRKHQKLEELPGIIKRVEELMKDIERMK